MILYLVPLVFFLLLSVFFSGSETAFMAVDRLRLKVLAESGDKTAASIKEIVSNSDRLLGVILLGNTISNIGAASTVTFLVTSYAPRDHVETAGIVSTIALTLVVLIFCELSPKMLAAAHSEVLCRRLVGPIRVSMWLLSPFARLAGRLANVVVRLAGMSAPASPFAHALSEEEIRAIIEGSTAATIAEENKEMLANVFEIGATRVRNVMVAISWAMVFGLQLIKVSRASQSIKQAISFIQTRGYLYHGKKCPASGKRGSAWGLRTGG